MSKFRTFLPPIFRAAIILGIGFLLYQQHQWHEAQKLPKIALHQVQTQWPQASRLSAIDPHSGLQSVWDQHHTLLGFAGRTDTDSHRYTGYIGHSTVLLLFDPQSNILSAQLLESADTPDHVEKILETPEFWQKFQQFSRSDSHPSFNDDFVTGASLTSDAIRREVLAYLDNPTPSAKFPTAIHLAEVQAVWPQAASLQPSTKLKEAFDVLDAQKNSLGCVLKSSPYSDHILGYSGPTDSLLFLDADALTLQAFRIRSSYDTDDYVGYVTDDRFFTRSLINRSVEEWQNLDFSQAGIEGATGATETSYAVTLGIKTRLQKLAAVVQPSSSIIFKLDSKAWLLLSLILVSLVYTSSPLKAHRIWRWVFQVLVISIAGLYLGSFLSVGLFIGWTQHGIPWQYVPVWVLLACLALLLPWTTKMNWYCHHYCPHGIAQQWITKLRIRPFKIPRHFDKLLQLIAPTILILLILNRYFQSPFDLSRFEIFDGWLYPSVTLISLGLTLLSLLLSFKIPMGYCRYACPTGALIKFVSSKGKRDQWLRRDTIAAFLFLLMCVHHYYSIH